jgi:uncharacterized membrane protein
MRHEASTADHEGMSTTSPVRPESAHPTRPAPPAHLEWLRSEVADWQREGLLDDRQSAAVLGRYHAARRMSLARLLLALGSVFVGFGVIWLIAANLDALPPLARFAAVALLWVAATSGAELLAVRRAHGGPIASPVVHGARLLAALLFGGVIFQAAQSLQVPAYEPRLVGLWALGALAHGYAVRAAAPMVVGIVSAFAWVIWDAAWAEQSALGVLLPVAALGVAGVSLAVVHDAVRDPGLGSSTSGADRGGRRRWSTMSAPWRGAGALALLGVLFTAALPFVDAGRLGWRPTLVVELVVAVAAAAAALMLALRPGTSRLLWAEPLGALAVTALAVLLVLWEAGADVDEVGAAGWAHAIVAVLTYLAVATGVAVMGILRDRNHLTVIALAALVIFTTFQSFAVFAQIIEGAWLFLVVGLILAGTGYLADRGRRQLAHSLDELTDPSTHGGLR